MLCAHTVPRLKPGTFDQFREAFGPQDEKAPRGWIRFHMLRGLVNPDEVVTFGLFDGTVKAMERGQDETGYREQRDAIEPFVEVVIANGIHEVAETSTRRQHGHRLAVMSSRILGARTVLHRAEGSPRGGGPLQVTRAASSRNSPSWPR
jgi:hypothetical protein